MKSCWWLVILTGRKQARYPGEEFPWEKAYEKASKRTRNRLPSLLTKSKKEASELPVSIKQQFPLLIEKNRPNLPQRIIFYQQQRRWIPSKNQRGSGRKVV